MTNFISLAGEWDFKLDTEKIGISEKWYNTKFSDKLKLPGSTDEAGFGTKNTKKDQYRLSRVYEYIGAAWYQKQVNINEKFNKKTIILFLERCHFETRVWVDGKEIGMQDSLSTSHQFDVSNSMTPGKHSLSIRVDNTIKYNVGKDAHSITRETQTNWNGIIGKIGLEIYDKIHIEDIQVYPNIKDRSVKIFVTIQNNSKEVIHGKLSLKVATWNTKLVENIPEKIISFSDSEEIKLFEVDYEIGNNLQLWDEFSPVLYKLTTCIEGEMANSKFNSIKTTDFGMRDFKTEGTQFTINGRRTFLRGTLECCVFPLTGYPPMDLIRWLKIFGKAKSYGLNHIRFHSWCPPEVAFSAADISGLMLQIETPVWTTLGENPEDDQFIYSEGDRILKNYGNHPSFCMLAVGNEPSGENQVKFLSKIVSYWRNKDSRHLYTGCSGWPEIEENNYHCLKNRKGVLRCQDWEAELNGRLNAKPLTTDFDFSEQIAGCEIPIVSHEVGQWCVYPNFKEMEKYIGILKPLNFEIAKDSLMQKGMLNQAQDFLMASGKLQTLLYKEEIEAAMRTPGFGGFQLLGLTDFPGQGTALVGLLDAFWETKGYVSENEFHKFCCETVPLLRVKKVIWANNDSFKADIEIANFGAIQIEDAVIAWSIDYKDGRNVAANEFTHITLPVNNNIKISNIEVKLDEINTPSELIITVAIRGTEYINNWSIWVYAKDVDLTMPKAIVVTETIEETIKKLEQGKKVLFLPTSNQFKSDRVPAGFTNIFWNTIWTEGQKPYTLGILCNPQNPALREFITDFHSNWHWFELIEKSRFMILDEFQTNFKPIIQVIDDWNKNHKLGLLIEAKIGAGDLLLCSINLKDNLDERPVARQMLCSLLKYIGSNDFMPQNNINIKQLESIFL